MKQIGNAKILNVFNNTKLLPLNVLAKTKTLGFVAQAKLVKLADLTSLDLTFIVCICAAYFRISKLKYILQRSVFRDCL